MCRLFFYLCAYICLFTLSESVTKLLVDESTVSLSTYVVHGLEPDTLYQFFAVSLTAAGPSYQNSSIVEARTGGAGLVAGHYAGIVIGVSVVLVLVIIGVFTCYRYVIRLFTGLS